MEKIQAHCMARGAKGILGFSRVFRFLDDNADRKLSKEEIKYGLHEYGIELSEDDIESIFESFDRDENGTIIFDEFLRGLRPPMSDSCMELVDAAFDKMDLSGEGVVTVEDLRGVYNASQHPKFLSGEMTEDEIFLKFLNNFDCPNDPDGKITKQDFLSYYAGVKASIDEDEYFEEMMRKAWQL